MKILVPIMNSEDVDILNPDLYNTEFFCGYLPQWWIDEYNNSKEKNGNLATPINNRNGRSANVTSLDELKEITKKAKEYNTDVFLVLNAKYYPDFVYDRISKYVDEVVSAGITRMIVCDIGMINFLLINYPQIRVSVSCLNQVTNKLAVEFYRMFGNVDRIVFPRHMSTDEIEQIASSISDFEYEYFVFSNKCLYDDGYCRGIHEFTPICKDLYFMDFYAKNGKSIDSSTKRQLTMAGHEYSDWTRSELMCEENNYCTPNFACSACSLVRLIKLPNISSVKLSIRGHDVSERLKQVKMANAVIEEVENGTGIDQVKKMISQFYGKESLCEDGTSCMMI